MMRSQLLMLAALGIVLLVLSRREMNFSLHVQPRAALDIERTRHGWRTLSAKEAAVQHPKGPALAQQHAPKRAGAPAAQPQAKRVDAPTAQTPTPSKAQSEAPSRVVSPDEVLHQVPVGAIAYLALANTAYVELGINWALLILPGKPHSHAPMSTADSSHLCHTPSFLHLSPAMCVSQCSKRLARLSKLSSVRSTMRPSSASSLSLFRRCAAGWDR